jgi:energy-coupling factor transporter ATP-binding protein EcfA2
MNESGAAQDATALLRRISEWIDRLESRGLANAPDVLGLRELIRESRAERLDTSDDPLLVILLCGATAVGKSSLINAIAGAEISAPGLGAMTSAAVVYLHEDADGARLFEYSRLLGELGCDSTSSSVVRHRQRTLRQKVLVDTPDIDSALRNHARLTGEIVHCADIVLFVTSPEKYKVGQSLSWIGQQREQRALAFVINKWDRESLGPQRAARDCIERDFRGVLDEVGFQEPVLFRVSSLTAEETGSAGDIENEIVELRDWLDRGLNRSAALDIQNRRRRAAWGRVGAAVAAARPASLSHHDFPVSAAEQFEAWWMRVTPAAQTETEMVPFHTLAGDARPATPGLYGSWTRLRRRVGSFPLSIRGLVGSPGATVALLGRMVGQADSTVPPKSGFGAAAAASLEEVASQLEKQSLAHRFPCGPLGSVWLEQARALGRQLTKLPLEVEQQVANVHRGRSLRRTLGAAVLYGTDLAMTAVLLVGLWRLTDGFVIGHYATSGLIGNAIALLIAFAVVGDLAAGLFFPRLQDAARRALSQVSADLLRQEAVHAQAVLAEHIRAAEDLAAEGTNILDEIDRIVGATDLAVSRTQVGDRLFGREMTRRAVGTSQSLAPSDGACVEPSGRRPVFD